MAIPVSKSSFHRYAEVEAKFIQTSEARFVWAFMLTTTWFSLLVCLWLAVWWASIQFFWFGVFLLVVVLLLTSLSGAKKENETS